MKNAFILSLLLLAPSAFADIPLHIQCFPINSNEVTKGELSAFVTLLSEGLVQGRIDSLKYTNEYKETYGYSDQLQSARPEVGYEYGEGATGLTFQFPKDRGSLDRVVLVLEQNMKETPKTSSGDLVIRRKHGIDQKARVVCTVEGNE